VLGQGQWHGRVFTFSSLIHWELSSFKKLLISYEYFEKGQFKIEVHHLLKAACNHGSVTRSMRDHRGWCGWVISCFRRWQSSRKLV